MRLTDGGEARHPLVVELVGALPASTDGPWTVSAGDLIRFWDAVEAAGTPLLLPRPDGGVIATFVWRERPDDDVDTVVVSIDGRHTPLAHLAGTDVWFADVPLESDFAAPYCFHLGVDGVLFDEDVHEPWEMSFADPLSFRRVQEEDALAPRSIVRATGVSRAHELAGELTVVECAATLLGGPRATPTFPFVVYAPPRAVTAADASLPLVVLLNGQFLDSSDAVEQLDRAMDDGRLPPALVVTSCSARGPGEHTAWGWRNGYGPHDLSAHLTRELLPALRTAHDLAREIHLVSWGYTAHAAVRTALGLADAASVTLLQPSGVRDAARDEIAVDAIARDAAALLEAGTTVLLSERPRRRGEDQSEETSQTFAEHVARATARPLRRVRLSDPNMVAAAASVVDALADVLRRS